MLQLYKALHPEDTEVTEEDIRIGTLNTIMVNGLHNDLSFFVRDAEIIMFEAQSSWSENMPVREFGYVWNQFAQYIEETGQNVYGPKKVILPRPELYALFPGQSGPPYQGLADHFPGGKTELVDFRVKCIYDHPGDDILAQYIRCTEICNEEIQDKGRTASETALVIQQRCIEEGVLVEFMDDIKKGKLATMVQTMSDAEMQEKLVASLQQEVENSEQKVVSLQQDVQQRDRKVQSLQQKVETLQQNIKTKEREAHEREATQIISMGREFGLDDADILRRIIAQTQMQFEQAQALLVDTAAQSAF